MKPDPASSSPRHLDSAASAPIGLFDSGIGGLTVAGAIHQLLPAEPLAYIGDLARVPYGGRSPETVQRYSFEISRLLLEQGAKIIVVACNSASAVALDALQQALDIPVLGVIEPGAAAAVASTRAGVVGVIGTRATIESGAYEQAIHRLNPDIQVVSVAAPLLVPLIEEGWLDDPLTEQIAARYLAPMETAGIDTLVLGCTHYPLLKPLLRKVIGPGVTLVDSAQNCALAVRELLRERKLDALVERGPGRLHVALTDRPAHFLTVAAGHLQIDPGTIHLIEPPSR